MSSLHPMRPALSSMPPRVGRFAASFLSLVPCALPQGSPLTVSYDPDDPEIAYTEYVCAHLSSTRASFDRVLHTGSDPEFCGTGYASPAPFCSQELMSPGVRANFRTKATHVKFVFEYLDAGAVCCNDDELPLSWEFGLEIDGVLQGTGTSNPLYVGVSPPVFCPTSNPPSTRTTPWIELPDAAANDVSLIWPSGADVDLLEVRLKGVLGVTPPTLLTPPDRPPILLGVHGGSIVQGLYAPHVVSSYPALLAAVKGWSVVNLGFAGRQVEPADAWTAGGMDLCTGDLRVEPLDLLILQCASNDFHLGGGVHTPLDTFECLYGEWIDQFRALQDDTPILVLTPMPRGDECGICGRTLEQYREKMRDILAALDDPDIYLFEGRDMIDPLPELFHADTLHPNLDGHAMIADRFNRMNLIRNGSFELKPNSSCLGCPLSGCDPCDEVAAQTPYLWSGSGVSIVDAGGLGGSRALSVCPGYDGRQVVYGLSAGDAFTLEADGKVVTAGESGTVTLEFLNAAGNPVGFAYVLLVNATTWQHHGISGTAPAGAVRGRVKLAKEAGGGDLLMDDVALTLAEF